jgi:hypothetical protein
MLLQVEAGDLWTGPEDAWRVVPTNLVTRRDGTAVMGAGVALQAAGRFPELPARYGRFLEARTPGLFRDDEFRIVCLPTKMHWREGANPAIVSKGLLALRTFALVRRGQEVRLPMIGAGLGRLPAKDVRDLIQRALGSLPNVTLVLSGAEVARSLRLAGESR